MLPDDFSVCCEHGGLRMHNTSTVDESRQQDSYGMHQRIPLTEI